MGHPLWFGRCPNHDLVHVRILQVGPIEEAGEEARYTPICRFETISVRQYEILRDEDDNTPDLHDVHRTYRNAFRHLQRL